MSILFNLWFSTVSSWFPTWEMYGADSVRGWVTGVDEVGTDLFTTLLGNLHYFGLPDFVYLIGCVLIVVLFVVGLFALFKWMFTLVWRLFKID